jgi:hypothetical protein
MPERGAEDGGCGGEGAGERRRHGSSPGRVHAPALHGASGVLQSFAACVSWKLCLGLPLVLDRVGEWLRWLHGALKTASCSVAVAC